MPVDITYREGLGRNLTPEEGDANFQNLANAVDALEGVPFEIASILNQMEALNYNINLLQNRDNQLNDEINNLYSQIGQLADQLSLQTYTIYLDRAYFDGNMLTPIVITAAELGIPEGHGIKLHQNLTEFQYNPDGIAFVGNGKLSVFTTDYSTELFRVTDNLNLVTTPRTYYSYLQNPSINISCVSGDLAYAFDDSWAGGGPYATMTVKLFYKPIPIPGL